MANVLKYAFNLAPTAGSLAQPNFAVLPANGSAGLPLITADSQGQLVISFVRRKASTAPGISYSVETGSSLSGFTALSLAAAVVTSIDETWERVRVTDAGMGGTRFGRVRVTVP